jgi:hypothetical protein
VILPTTQKIIVRRRRRRRRRNCRGFHYCHAPKDTTSNTHQTKLNFLKEKKGI